MRSRRCRCGHYPGIHIGRNTECRGRIPDGENALGIKLIRPCDCQEYRRTGRRYFHVKWDGTEEQPA